MPPSLLVLSNEVIECCIPGLLQGLLEIFAVETYSSCRCAVRRCRYREDR